MENKVDNVSTLHRYDKAGYTCLLTQTIGRAWTYNYLAFEIR